MRLCEAGRRAGTFPFPAWAQGGLCLGPSAGRQGTCVLLDPPNTPQVSGFRGSAPVVKAKPGSLLSAWCVESHPMGREDARPPYLGIVRGNAVAGIEALM